MFRSGNNINSTRVNVSARKVYSLNVFLAKTKTYARLFNIPPVSRQITPSGLWNNNNPEMFKCLINHEVKRNSFVVALTTEMSEILLFSVIDSVDLVSFFGPNETNERANKQKQICD